MRTPTPDRPPSSPGSPARVRRYHRSTIVVTTGALLVLAVSAGAAVALSHRQSPAAASRPAVASPTTQSPPQITSAPRVATPTTGAPAAQQATPVTASAPGPGRVRLHPVLADGTYPAFIREIDVNRRTMVIDVVQVFEGEAAVKAAITDGRSPTDAQYLYIYIRNQSSRLRTLPVASDATIKFLGTCEGPANTRAVLSELSKRAATRPSYYALTVGNGSVRRIVEHQSQPAC